MCFRPVDNGSLLSVCFTPVDKRSLLSVCFTPVDNGSLLSVCFRRSCASGAGRGSAENAYVVLFTAS